MSLSNYEIQKVLGKGAFGTVIKVKNKNNGLIYAMKRINLLAISDEEIQAALNEIRLLYSLTHPNIINYKEAFYDKPTNSLNMVLEFAGDGDLSQKVKMYKKYHKRIDENTIWDWIIQLIIGIYYLHCSGCIHRDLKCANIFLKKNGLIKIGDLNVSKYLKKNTYAETMAGTPLYIPPEMIEDLPYSNKCDIWSLGCVIYELCALEPPFNGKNLPQLYKNIKSGKYIPIPSQYSNDLKKIIALMLQTNPNKRISSEELLYLPIIKSKMNKNYSKYQELIEKIKQPKIIETIFPNQNLPKKDLIKKPIRSKSKKNSPNNRPKSKKRNTPELAKKKKIINKLKDCDPKKRAISARKNKQINYQPIRKNNSKDYLNNNEPSYFRKNTHQNYNEFSDRKYDYGTKQDNYHIKIDPSVYSKKDEMNNNEFYKESNYKRGNQIYNLNVAPGITDRNNLNYNEYNEGNYYNRNKQINNLNIAPSFPTNSNLNYNEYNEENYTKRNYYKQNNAPPINDTFDIKKESNDFDSYRPINDYIDYNNYQPLNQNNFANMAPTNNFKPSKLNEKIPKFKYIK